MHPSRNLIWTRSLLKVGFYLFHWDPNAVKVESYLKQSQKCTINYFSLFPCSLCSSCCIQGFMKVTLCIYTLGYNGMWSGGLCCTVQYEKGFIGTIPIWIAISFIYTCTGAHNPYVLGTQGRNYDMYLGLEIRYESEIWTIVTSMNRAFKWCQFCCGLNFDPNRE